MESKSKRLKFALYSTVGVAVMAAILIAVNAVVRVTNVRADLTQEKLFTLSPGTKAILKKLDTTVTIRYYFSRDVAEMPVFLRTYATRVEDLLKEYRAVSGGRILIQTLNPTPDSDAEDSANLDGVTGQAPGGGEQVYLGVAVNCLDKTVALPFLSPDRETLLEYDLTRAIYQVLHTEKPVVGVMSSLPVMGGAANPMMMMQMQQRPEKPWMIVTELKKDFAVKEVPMETDQIPSEIKVLVLIHPKGISDKALWAIDQFVLRGGRVMAFLDPMSIVEARTSNSNPMNPQPPGVSTLGKLLDAWGVSFDTEKMVADIEVMTRVAGEDGKPMSLPTVLSLTKANLDRNDPATANLESVMMGFCSSFGGNGADTLKKTVLIQSTDNSKAMEKFMAQMPGDAMLRDFKADGAKKALAVKLAGKFKTAFPDGKPEAPEPPASADKEKKDEPQKAAKEQGLKVSEKDSMVVLFGDSDMLYDQFCVQVQNFFGQQLATPLNDNFALVQNVVEQLSGDENLISIRSRGVIKRPFDVVNKMQLEAEQRFQDKIRQYENDLSEAQRKIGEMQREKKGDQKFILSAEQKAAIAKFKEQEAEARKALKTVRKQLRQDVDSLQTKLKVLNIAFVPILVGLSGIGVAFAKKRRTKSA